MSSLATAAPAQFIDENSHGRQQIQRNDSKFKIKQMTMNFRVRVLLAPKNSQFVPISWLLGQKKLPLKPMKRRLGNCVIKCSSASQSSHQHFYKEETKARPNEIRK